ncbi:hypothetical protein HOV93_34170 [Planctomycetes bacterium FF15]|uniref:Uncharacterized protein n=1 Tax=Bremerella alba TaxID=980252 RepID=A0A7V9A8F0_9BACT|nr:hypothetical protein [Bremerella alba]
MNFKMNATRKGFNKTDPGRQNQFIRQHHENPAAYPNCPDDCNRQECPGKPEDFIEFPDFAHDTFPI